MMGSETGNKETRMLQGRVIRNSNTGLYWYLKTRNWVYLLSNETLHL